jgi:hypothetical protein
MGPGWLAVEAARTMVSEKAQKRLVTPCFIGH